MDGAVISKKEFIEKFTHIKDNYVLEIATGKTYAFSILDDPQYEDMIQLIEPEEFEDNLEKIQNELLNFIEELKRK